MRRHILSVVVVGLVACAPPANQGPAEFVGEVLDMVRLLPEFEDAVQVDPRLALADSVRMSDGIGADLQTGDQIEVDSDLRLGTCEAPQCDFPFLQMSGPVRHGEGRTTVWIRRVDAFQPYFESRVYRVLVSRSENGSLTVDSVELADFEG